MGVIRHVVVACNSVILVHVDCGPLVGIQSSRARVLVPTLRADGLPSNKHRARHRGLAHSATARQAVLQR